MPEILPKLAPGNDHAADIEIADRNRPDGSLADAALFVLIADGNLAARPDSVAQRDHVDPIGGIAPSRWRERMRFYDERPQILGHGGTDLGGSEAARVGREGGRRWRTRWW